MRAEKCHVQSLSSQLPPNLPEHLNGKPRSSMLLFWTILFITRHYNFNTLLLTHFIA